MDSHDNPLDNVSSSPAFSETPPFPSTQCTTVSRDSPLSDLLGQSFLLFDHHTTIIVPFIEETERFRFFREELSTMLLEAILETDAWSTSRYKVEDNNAVRRFEQGISGIMEIEKEQEKMREHLMDFVNQLKNAIVALTAAMV